jgi:hypothetical protein
MDSDQRNSMFMNAFLLVKSDIDQVYNKKSCINLCGIFNNGESLALPAANSHYY